MTILLLLIFPCFTVWLIEHWVKRKYSHLIRSGAYPNCVNALHSTHYFELCIVDQPLLQVLIQLPHCLQVTGDICVTDQWFKRIYCSSQVLPHQVRLQFTQAVLPGHQICVSLRGVSSSHRSSQVWLYTIHGSASKTAAFVLLGVARISTFPASLQCNRFPGTH